MNGLLLTLFNVRNELSLWRMEKHAKWLKYLQDIPLWVVPLVWTWMKNPAMSIAKTFQHKPWFSKWPWAQVLVPAAAHLIPPRRVMDICCRNAVTPRDRLKAHRDHRTDCVKYTEAYLLKECLFNKSLHVQKNWASSRFLNKAVCAGVAVGSLLASDVFGGCYFLPKASKSYAWPNWVK